MSSEEANCEALLMNETDLAILVAPLHSPIGGKSWWLPRAQIRRLSKERRKSPFVGGGERTVVKFTLPEWLCQEKGCWEIAK